MKQGRSGWRLFHHVVGALIVLGWAAIAIARQLDSGRAEFSLDQVPPPSASADQRFYGIYFHDKKIGFAQSTRESLDDGGARFRDRAYWRFQAQGSVQRLSMESLAVLDPSWSLRSFSSRIDGGMAKMEAHAEVRGDRLDLRVQTGGRTLRDSLPVEGPLLVPGVLRAFVAARKPEPGSAFQVDIYNPLIRGTEPVEIVVEDRTDEGWRVAEILRGSIKTTAWIDERGATLREQSFMGFLMVAEPREQALTLPEDSDSLPDLVFAASVPVQGDIDAAKRHGRLWLRLSGVEAADFPALQGGRQSLHDGVLSIEASPLPGRAPFALPIDLAALEPMTEQLEAELRDGLASEILVQSDDKAIVHAAEQIVGDEKDPVAATRLIADWVHRKIRKASSVGVPSAVEVLTVRSGDCNEHTVLFTALARAAGIPTRMAAGVVHADVGGGMPGMYYHAWPEVWLGDWFAVDPTFGQVPADASHLRFIVGGLDQQVAILRLIGSLEIALAEEPK